MKALNKNIIFSVFLLAVLVSVFSSNCFSQAIPETDEALNIDYVWPGHPVGFDLLTYSNFQFAAFFDSNRWMTIAQREIESTNWSFVRLPSQLGWDSHNYVTVEIDSKGCVHVSGNMHNVPLIYFRTTNGFDINSFIQIKKMTGNDENSCTQPQFIINNNNELIFTYRDGGSGNGKRIYNIYDTKTEKWRRLLDKPLLSGEGKMNAYHYGPAKGPDGFFHLAWVWRDSPDCSSNHDLNYARSRDLVNWETGSGKPLELPITARTAEVVDPVATGEGMLNGNTMISFDAEKRPMITYHKFDKDGNTQLYQARLENGKWKNYKITDWKYKWDFSGGGCIVERIKFKPMWRAPDDNMLLWFRHVLYGKQIWLIDNKTLKPISELIEPLRPLELEEITSEFPGMKVQWRNGRGNQPDSNSKFWLRWETLDYNRDKQREGQLPKPHMLKIYNLKRPSPTKTRKICLTNIINLVDKAIKKELTFSTTNLLKNGTFSDGMKHWFLWKNGRQFTNSISIVPCKKKYNGTNAIRIENSHKKLLGIQNSAHVSSGQIYRLSGWVRSVATNNPKIIFGGRIGFFLPPQKEKEIVWMSEHNKWWQKELIFTNHVTGLATVYVHMGYGNVASTGEFSDIKLELIGK